MAHNANCSNAKSPPRDCECSCGGALHGGGSQRLGHGPWGRNVDYNHSGYRTRLGDSLDGLTVRFFDALFKPPSDDFTSPSDGALVDTASDLIADEIARLLGRNGSERFRRDLRQDHTICSLMVAMVRAMTTLRDVAPEATRQTVEEIVKRSGGAAGRLDARLAGKTAKVVVEKLQDTTTLGSLPLYIKTCRCVAITSCPDPVNHYDVREHCAEPLAKEMISTEFRHLLKELTEHWHENRYRAGRLHNVALETVQSADPDLSSRPVPAPIPVRAEKERKRFSLLKELKRRWPFGRH